MSEPVVVKLINGDMFMATVLNDETDTLIVADPIAVRQVSVATEGGVVEKTVTQPFCSLTLDREFSFDRRQVLFVKPLNPKIAKYYAQLIQSFLQERSEDDDFGQTVFEDQNHEESEEPMEDEGFLIIPDVHNVH